MSFSSTITITGSTNITNFDIYQCPTSGCTGCVAITGSTGENVSRTKLLTGHTVSVDQGFRYIKLVADTTTCNNSICMPVIGIPTFTPTPTPSFTPTPTGTPTPTATNVPPGSTSTPTPTATNVPPGSTNTPTPTATSTPTPTATNVPTFTPTPTNTSIPLKGCGDNILGTYDPTGSTIQSQYLDLSAATNGAQISIHYTANSRPDRFSIKENGLSIVANSGWVGSDYNYTGPWTYTEGIEDTDGDGYMYFTYDSSKTYQLIVDVGPANPSNPLSDSWSVTIGCSSATSTPTPTPTSGGGGGGGGGFVSQTYGCVNDQCTQGVGNYSTYAECCANCPGCSSGGGGCPTPDMLMMIDGGWIKAGDLNVGDMVYTQHELTKEWGNYRIDSMSFEIQPVLNVMIGDKKLKVSDSHKFLIENGEYVSISDINIGNTIQTIDGLKELKSKENIGNNEVVRFEIEEAHTYVVEGMISHNKAPIDQELN